MKKLNVYVPKLFAGGLIDSLGLTTATVEELKDFLVKYIHNYTVYLADYNTEGHQNLIDVRLDPRFIDYMGKFYENESKPLITATPAQVLADTPAQEYQELLSFLQSYKKPKNAPYYL